jgi:hypothetical protein
LAIAKAVMMQKFAIEVSLECLLHVTDAQLMYRSHATSQFFGEVAPAKMNVLQGRLNAAMPGKECDLMNVPVGASEIGQTQMT